VFGRPALVETSDFANPAADQRHLMITPWTDAGWGAPCRLTLTYRIDFAVTERFCGDPDICAAAALFAANIAAAHGKAAPDAPFAYGQPASKDALDLVDKVGGAQPEGAATPLFPTFGDQATAAFAAFPYNRVDLFPLELKGVTYIAAVGYGGVGWRGNADTLLAIYGVDEGQLQPQAGLVVARSVVGLASAVVDRPTPADHR